MALNSLISIMQRVPGDDALGQVVETWAELAEVWGEIRHPSGLEQVRADAQISTVRASIKVHQRTDITAAMRAVHAGTTYDIKAVLPDASSRVYMFLACEATS